MTKFSRTSTGKYSVAGKTYDSLIGTRAQVWHGTAYKTSGGLTHIDLIKNKAGRIVSKTKHNTAKREKRLVKAGYVTRKGHFGFVKKGSRSYRGSKRGGTGAPMGSGFPNDSPMGQALSHGGSRRRKHGGTGEPMGMGFPNGSPMGQALSHGGSRRRKHGGSYTVNSALSPSPISGIKSTSGVDLQFVAGNAG